MFTAKSNDKLPPTHDIERATREQEAFRSKEKIVEVTGALGEGKLPTTSQISTAIDEIHQSEILHDAARGMSVLGKKISADLENFLEALKIFLKEKNRGDEIQNLVYNSSRAINDNLPSGEEIKQEISDIATTSKPLLSEGVEKTLNISRLLISSSEFRKLVNDISTIAQDIIAYAVNEEPNQNNDNYDKEKGIDEAITEIGQKAREQVYPTVKTTAKITEPYIKDASEGKTSVQDSAKEGLMAITSNVKSVISGYQLSPKAREQLITRFKNVMIELQYKPEYQQAIHDLINIVSQITEKSSEFATHVVQPIIDAATASSSTSSSDDETHHQHQPSRSRSSTLTPSSIEVAEQNAKELIERFANNRSLDPLISEIHEFGQKMENDDDLREFLKELKQFVLSSLLEAKFIKNPNYVRQGFELIERGQRILLDHYGELTRKIINEVLEFNKAMLEDKKTLKLKNDINILIEDFFLNELGHFTIKFQLIKDFSIVLPRLAKKLEYIPLPRYECFDENVEFIADNIIVHLYEFLPKHINIGLNADIDVERPEEDRVINIITVEISKFHIDARNIAFFYKKKYGPFKFRDFGFVDFSIPRDGYGLKLNIKARFTIPTDGSKPISIKLEQSDVHISELKLRFHDTKYKLLYKIFLPFIERSLKGYLENAITEACHQLVEKLENQLIFVQAQMQKYHNYNKTDAGEGQSEDKLKQKKAWKSGAFDPTLGATTSEGGFVVEVISGVVLVVEEVSFPGTVGKLVIGDVIVGKISIKGIVIEQGKCFLER
ncbi:19117_t:CDS:2 [Entrophospora sp. SA101]|nr:19117_t:CDS:2 [Entrophospora sp. SA101]